MKKIAIFVEGYSELIFTRELLLRIFSYENLSILCLSIKGDREREVPYKYEDKPQIYFQIVNVGNDERVLSYICERFSNIISKGFDAIIGLRDIYSAEYLKRSRVIDEQLITLFIDSYQRTADSIQDGHNVITLFYAIMEFESWLLSMPRLLSRYNAFLSIENIENELGYDLSIINPQKEFLHPCKQFEDILQLVGINYDKSQDIMESIISNLDINEINNLIGTSKCSSLLSYYNNLSNYLGIIV